MEYKFEVKALEAGQRGKYQDSFYSYEVTSKLPNFTIKAFCMNVLKLSYSSDKMPNPFAGELLVFERITENNKGRNWKDDVKSETYLYKTKELYTG